MKKITQLRLWAASLVDYAFWLLILTVIDNNTSLYIPSVLRVFLAPIMTVGLGMGLIYFFGQTLGHHLLGLKVKKPVDLRKAFFSTLPQFFPSTLEVEKDISFWRYIICLVIGISSIGVQFNDPVYGFSAQSRIENSSWIQYTHDKQGFSVYFPEQPEEENKPLIPNGESNLTITEMSASQKKGTYAVSYLKMPKKWTIAGEKTILKVATDLIVKHTPGAELVSKEIGEYQGFKVVNYVYKVDNKEVTGRLLIHHQTLYKLAVEYPEGTNITENIKSFFSSFAINEGA